MPLKISRDAPENGAHFIEMDLAENASVPLPGPWAGPVEKYVVAPAPIRTYALQLDHVQKGYRLEAAKPGPWLYFLVPDTAATSCKNADPVGGVELIEETPSEEKYVGRVAMGPIYVELCHCLNDADVRFDHGEYEPRLLSVPALGVRALWCHKSAAGADDWFTSLGPTENRAKEPWIPMDDFLRRLQALAKTTARNAEATLPLKEQHHESDDRTRSR